MDSVFEGVRMSEVKKCIKCGGEMEIGYLPGAFSWSAGKSLWKLRGPKRILGYAHENCGYVEFYLELKEKEKKGVLNDRVS